MTSAYFYKSHAGLSPSGEEAAELMQKLRMGETVLVEVKRPRNVRFFRKWWTLARVAYDIWSETVPPMEYKGRQVSPDFDRFRRDLIILAGKYRPVYNAKGELRLEAESISWAKMTEQEFEVLYSETINVVLRTVLAKGAYNEEELRRQVDLVMGFS